MKIISKKLLISMIFEQIFNGIPQGSEFSDVDFYKMSETLKKDLSYREYIQVVGLSDDGLAYATPWFSYDSSNYSEFVLSVYKHFGFDVAQIFFTQHFKDYTSSINADIIKRIFFDSFYFDEWK